jgi:DNA polymerase
MGVDMALENEPCDRFAQSARAPAPPPADPADFEPAGAAQPAPPSRVSVAPPASGDGPQNKEAGKPLRRLPDIPAAPAAQARPDAAALSAQTAVLSARELAAGAKSLDELATATQLVFADGAPGSRLMLIGEGPGADEDRIGRPFVGRAGQLLDKMLAAIGLDRTQVYIANAVPWRPPGNRAPTPQELAICLPFVRRQIELAQPDILVFLGNASAQTLLDTREGIMRLRGIWREYDCAGRAIKAMPMIHPSYLLRVPARKREAWRDLRALRHALDALSKPQS